jgi:hypothetical protein
MEMRGRLHIVSVSRVGFVLCKTDATMPPRHVSRIFQWKYQRIYCCQLLCHKTSCSNDYLLINLDNALIISTASTPRSKQSC